MRNENQQLQAENTRLKEQLTTTTDAPTSLRPVVNTTINNNIVIVNLPAVTRIGSTGDPLMCSDIPLPDVKTVKALLDDPENAVSSFVYKRYFASRSIPSISAPDATNKRLRLVHRDKRGNHWVDASLDSTIDDIVYKTLDSLDDDFEAMSHKDFKNWKRREGLTSVTGFDRTDAYQKLQNDVKDVLKNHGRPYENVQ